MIMKKPKLEIRETLEILEKEVAASEKIISSLFDYARPRPPTRSKVDLNEVVQEVLSDVTMPENIAVMTQLDESLPTIQGDPHQLGQVLVNLTLNAIQAMPTGGQLTIKSESEGPDWVSVSIADTGVGIAEENIEKLFEPLFTTKAKGMGLGLAIVKTIVDGHEGTIEVESELGKGSVFFIRLPMRIKEVA
jgi:signal transduction histidine kinase